MSKDIIKIKEQILNSFLENLAGISDKEYQKRVWIRAEGPECDDFDEAVCDFFDLGDYIFNDYKSYGITKDQYKVLVKFRHAFEVFSDENNWPQDFIDTPEWEEIMNMAKDVLKAFYYQNKKRGLT